MTQQRPQIAWQRLSPRMLLVHPAHELLRELPLLIGVLVLGSTTGNQSWTVAVLVLSVGVGVARWFTTSYRIESDRESGQVQLRSGLLQRKVLSVPRNRIRSVQTDARLLHRLLGLTVLRLSTGQQATAEHGFELNAVRADQVPRLRAILLADSPQPGDAATAEPAASSTVLARWQPSWLRYAPLSLSGLLIVVAAAGVVYQSGAVGPLQHSRLVSSGLAAAARLGVVATVAVIAAVVLIASVLLAVLRSLLVYGNLVLTRRADVLHLRHGLLRLREHTYDMSRLRGGTLRQPLLVRVFGGARLDAVMTGVHGAGESSVLLPPCPAATAEAVLAGLVGGPESAWVVVGPLRGHGGRAASRRWTRALGIPVLIGVALAATALLGISAVPLWLWTAWVAVTAWCALLAADRVGALGHRVDSRWLVMRSGSLDRRRDCLATAGVIGWTVRQSPLQRRAGVATLVAATAAGVKRYPLIDVPEDQAWAVAAEASPWVADSIWAIR
ncbi:PH domain-containing protein [Candidatus Mycobacterium methanotrophicum]|uniref:PH domain-containing protein n=1 Tax=Candidatus Mycobacterium methanotrophicum TaxID=2943498 RepID=A0ABY4QLP8_9MYCO|nr:PH domain-containing protein [Candidatus Mycobacterium methanotrophicum]UQX11960.1 PH domain-containing protein [Candidatus Mycobacterium methanotrophicum]